MVDPEDPPKVPDPNIITYGDPTWAAPLGFIAAAIAAIVWLIRMGF